MPNSAKNQKKAIIFLMVIFVSWAIAVRFYNITAVGIEGDDVFWYWETAKDWALGNKTVSFGYRPATSYTYSLAMKIFGINDYSLKVSNSLINLLSGMLIFYCSLLTYKDKMISILSSIIYLSLPFVIQESRTELSHILSTFYFLISYLFFCLYFQIRRLDCFKKYLFLSLSGQFLGITAHVHPDLATQGLPFVLFIMVVLFKKLRGQKDFEKNYQTTLLKEISIFSVSYLTIFIFFIAQFGLVNVIKNLSQGFSHQQTNQLSRSAFENFSRYFYGTYRYIEGSISTSGAYLFLASILISIFLIIKKQKKSIIVYLPIFLVLFHLSTCVFIVQRKFILRLAHPTVPFMIMTILFWISSLMIFYKVIIRKYLLVAIAMFILLANGFTIFEKSNYIPTIYRQVHNQLGKNVTRESKILITPSLFHWYREGFKSSAYFGKNAIYLSQYRHGKWRFDNDSITNFKKLIKLNEIKYFLVVKKDKNVRKKLVYHGDTKAFFRSMYDISVEDYSLDWEYKQLKKITNSINSKIISTNEKFDIYEILR